VVFTIYIALLGANGLLSFLHDSHGNQTILHDFTCPALMGRSTLEHVGTYVPWAKQVRDMVVRPILAHGESL
jgi:hypothetical protein